MQKNTFPKKLRLKKKKNFEDVFDNGTKIKTKYYTIYFKPEKNLKVGIVISKKVGKAVLRNYVKRIMRELFRTTKTKFKRNIHMIIIPSKKYNWESLRFSKIKKCWMETIDKINKISNGLC